MNIDEFKIAIKVLEPKTNILRIEATPEHWADVTISAALLGLTIVKVPRASDWMPKMYRAFWFPDQGSLINPDQDFYFILPTELA